MRTDSGNDIDSGGLAELSPFKQRFVNHWGEMGVHWGVNRTVSRIHALLFIQGGPMTAEMLADQLQVARSNISNSLRELQNLKLVKPVFRVGDRRDWYETHTDVWTLFRTISEQRKQREFDPTLRTLAEFMESADFATEDDGVRRRVKETHALMQSLSQWGEEMLKLDPATLRKIMKLGGKIQKLISDAGAGR